MMDPTQKTTPKGPLPTRPGEPQQPASFVDRERHPQAGSEKMTGALDEARRSAEQVRDRAKASARETMGWAREQGAGIVADQKGRVAEKLGEFAAAADRAVGKLHEEGDANVANLVESVRDRLRGAADYLNRRTPGDIYRDFERLARRQPEVFVGSLFVGGLLLARFMKASHRTREEVRGDRRGGAGQSLSEGEEIELAQSKIESGSCGIVSDIPAAGGREVSGPAMVPPAGATVTRTAPGATGTSGVPDVSTTIPRP